MMQPCRRSRSRENCPPLTPPRCRQCHHERLHGPECDTCGFVAEAGPATPEDPLAKVTWSDPQAIVAKLDSGWLDSISPEDREKALQARRSGASPEQILAHVLAQISRDPAVQIADLRKRLKGVVWACPWSVYVFVAIPGGGPPLHPEDAKWLDALGGTAAEASEVIAAHARAQLDREAQEIAEQDYRRNALSKEFFALLSQLYRDRLR